MVQSFRGRCYLAAPLWEPPIVVKSWLLLVSLEPFHIHDRVHQEINVCVIS